jgi:hypothetical protein
VRFAHKQSLSISVDGHEFDSAKAGVNHSVKCINSTAANANNFDYR